MSATNDRNTLLGMAYAARMHLLCDAVAVVLRSASVVVAAACRVDVHQLRRHGANTSVNVHQDCNSGFAKFSVGRGMRCRACITFTGHGTGNISASAAWYQALDPCTCAPQQHMRTHRRATLSRKQHHLASV